MEVAIGISEDIHPGEEKYAVPLVFGCHTGTSYDTSKAISDKGLDEDSMGTRKPTRLYYLHVVTIIPIGTNRISPHLAFR
jgi:hypothetical protein